MSLTLIEEKKANLIINNLVKAATVDLMVLTNDAYVFIHMRSGFIAHYDRFGFIDTYQIAENLGDAILENRSSNQYFNFRPGDRDYEYMMQIRTMYNEVCEKIQAYRQGRLFAEFPYKCTLTVTIMANTIEEAKKELMRRIDKNEVAEFVLKVWRG